MFTDTRKFDMLIGLICFFIFNVFLLNFISFNVDMFSNSINKYFLFDDFASYNEYIKVFCVIFDEDPVKVTKFISNVYLFNNIFCKLIIFLIILNFVSYVVERRYYDSLNNLVQSDFYFFALTDKINTDIMSIFYSNIFSVILSIFKIILLIYVFNMVSIFLDCFKFCYFISSLCNIIILVISFVDIVLTGLYIITMFRNKNKLDFIEI